MLDLDVCRNLVKLAFGGVFKDCFPVFLVVASNRFNAKLPRACYPCVVLHAIAVGAIVHLHSFNMDLLVKLLNLRRPSLLFEIYEPLNMRGPLFPLF